MTISTRSLFMKRHCINVTVYPTSMNVIAMRCVEVWMTKQVMYLPKSKASSADGVVSYEIQCTYHVNTMYVSHKY